MISRHHLRSASILLLAAGGPPAIVWTSASIVRAFEAPPAKAERVQGFADYITPSDQPSTSTLPDGTQIWEGTPGDGSPFFVDMAVKQDSLLLLSRSRFLAMDASSGRVRQDVSVTSNDTFASSGASALIGSGQPNQVWLYSWESGKLRSYDYSTFTLLQTRTLTPYLRGLRWDGHRVLANGSFESELVRAYETPTSSPVTKGSASRPVPPAASDESDGAMQQKTAFGHSLFPGLVTEFRKPLNSTYMDIAPDRRRMVVAYQWSDKIDIYDLDRGGLERSIAGPVESKLDFAVAQDGSTKRFTLHDETQWSYVDVVATKDLIVGLYAGNVRKKLRTSFGNGQQLHVFTWDGRLVGIWRLQQPLQMIEIDQTRKVLYGLRWKPTTSVVAIDASPLFDSPLVAPGSGTVVARRRLP